MAGICCGVVGEGEAATAPIEPSSRPSRRRSLDMLSLRLMADVPAPETSRKRQKLDLCAFSSRDCDNALENRETCVVVGGGGHNEGKEGSSKVENGDVVSEAKRSTVTPLTTEGLGNEEVGECPKFGVTSVCGRRRDMEDSVLVRPSFCHESHRGFHYFGVFDGHGCSHVNASINSQFKLLVVDLVCGCGC